MFNRKIIITVVSTVLIASIFTGCNKKANNQSSQDSSNPIKITVSGSTSVGPIMENLSSEYMDSNKNIDIEVQQNGSSAGIANTIQDVSEIGMTSRNLKEDEKKQNLTDTKIAIDAIAIITNKENKVNNLSLNQLKDIYTGKITNWKDVGGKDAHISVISREDGSGTREGFESIVGYNAEEMIREAIISEGNGNVKLSVKNNVNAIGYISLEYADEHVNKVSIDNISANEDTVKANKYPLTREFLIVYKKDKIPEEAKKFIDYMLSEDGQHIVKDSGFIRVK
ncbi:MAG: phosphate ABC transporter substrate-binding protein [Clostridioides sp.]|jgi:phosphate transport system substrate-binding protein|nr:phosphate ABC transporter substrate-binding protein [Clostridioides sp.]